MNNKKYFENLYPFEKILPDLKEVEISEIIQDSSYYIEANYIANIDKLPCINLADAVVFYTMGYEAAQKRINNVLNPIEKNI